MFLLTCQNLWRWLKSNVTRNEGIGAWLLDMVARISLGFEIASTLCWKWLEILEGIEIYTIMKRWFCVSQVVTYYFCERCSMEDMNIIIVYMIFVMGFLEINWNCCGRWRLGGWEGIWRKSLESKIDLRNAFFYLRWFFFFVFEVVMQCVQQEENTC